MTAPDVWPFDPDEAAAAGWASDPLPVDDGGEWTTGESAPEVPDHDPITGEVLDDDVPGPAPLDPSPAPDAVALVVGGATEAAATSIDYLRSPELLAAMSAELRVGLRSMLDARHAQIRRDRPPGRVVNATLQPELSFLADAHEGLSALGSALSDAARQARDMAGEVLVDLEPERTVGTTSTKVGTASGTVKVTRTQPSAVVVQDAELIDVLASYLIGQLDTGDEDELSVGAAGIRAALDLYRELVGPPAWKSTALDGLARRMEAAGEDALAIRLGHAYGRIPKGKATVKIERTPDKPNRDTTTPESETP